MKELTAKQRAYLKSQAHALEPLLQIGKNGVTDNFLKELDGALEREELIKVRIGKFVDETQADEAAKKTKAALVAKLGRTVIYYRPAEEPRIELPEDGEE